MSVIRHFSDTRTTEGRVRFLLLPGEVKLVAEGQGWIHESVQDTFQEATHQLAALARVSSELYHAALDELERRLAFEWAA